METDDIFSNKMKVGRPHLVKQFRIVSIAIITDSGNIVGQGIQPYIYNMLRIKVYRNSPFERSSGYAQILKSRKKEVVHHLVLTGFRLNEFRMCLNVLDQTVCVFAHFEEISLFFGWYAWASAVRTFSVYKLGFCEEGLTWSTVHSLVLSLVDIPFCIHFLENLLNLFLMVFICGTDEFVIGCVHQIPDALDLTGYVINEFLRCNTCFFCFQLNLLAMLVSSGLEKYVVALLSFITRNGVCQNRLVGIANVRLAGCIGNGCGDVIFWFTHCISSFSV